MAFLESELAIFLFNVILTILMIVGFKILWTSGQASLSRTGGNWKSVIDEAIIGMLGLGVIIILWTIGPADMIHTVTKLILFIWDLVKPILRNLGLPF